MAKFKQMVAKRAVRPKADLSNLHSINLSPPPKADPSDRDANQTVQSCYNASIAILKTCSDQKQSSSRNARQQNVFKTTVDKSSNQKRNRIVEYRPFDEESFKSQNPLRALSPKSTISMSPSNR